MSQGAEGPWTWGRGEVRLRMSWEKQPQRRQRGGRKQASDRHGCGAPRDRCAPCTLRTVVSAWNSAVRAATTETQCPCISTQGRSPSPAPHIPCNCSGLEVLSLSERCLGAINSEGLFTGKVGSCPHSGGTGLCLPIPSWEHNLQSSAFSRSLRHGGAQTRDPGT